VFVLIAEIWKKRAAVRPQMTVTKALTPRSRRTRDTPVITTSEHYLMVLMEG